MRNRKVAVVGVGTMGHGIAQAFSQFGFEVILVGRREKTMKEALRRIRSNLAFFVENNIISAEESEKAYLRIEPSMNLEKAVADVEFVTEAIAEDLDLKQDLFQKMDVGAPSETVLSTNTSGLSVTEIAKLAGRPERIIGTNWWNPPHITPLVEIMKGERTTESTVRQTMRILEEAGKKPILLLKSIQGFVGNRLQFALFREALSLLENGVASAEDIDAAVSYGPGLRYPAQGPFKVADFGGVDVFHHVAKDIYGDLDCSKQPQKILEQLVDERKHGVKSGEGFYSYLSQNSDEAIKERDRKLLGIIKAIEER